MSKNDAAPGTGELASAISRRLRGDWANKLYNSNHGRRRRAEIDGAKGFQSLAAMMAFMNGADANDSEAEIALLEETYTSYGCYCWINGVDGGVTGGGRTKDMTDHHCKELYR